MTSIGLSAIALKAVAQIQRKERSERSAALSLLRVLYAAEVRAVERVDGPRDEALCDIRREYAAACEELGGIL